MMGVVGFAGAVAEVGVGRVSGAGGDVCPGVHASGRWLCAVEPGARESCLTVWATCSACSDVFGRRLMPLSLMGSAVQTVAHFMPTYWVNDAIGRALASI